MSEFADRVFKRAMSPVSVSETNWDVDLSADQVPQLIACKDCHPREGGQPLSDATSESSDKSPVRGDVDVLFVVDASGSMTRPFGQESKVDAAKGALAKLLSRLSDTDNPGLRIFGEEGLYWQYDEMGNLSNLSRTGMNPNKEACEQSSLLVSLAAHRRKIGMISQALNLFHAQGEQTPLQYAIEQAERDLYSVNPDKAKVLVLITDGGESCGGDPCAFVREMRKRHKDLRIDVIALAVDEQETIQMMGISQATLPKAGAPTKSASEQLRCVAEEGGGKYWDVHNEEELTSSLISTVKAEVSGRLLKKTTKPVGQ